MNDIIDMSKSEFQMLDFYDRRLATKLSKMHQTERVAYLADLFGRRWIDVHHRLSALYPELM